MDVATEIILQLQLKTIPHFTTLQKAAARISERTLHVAIGRFIRIISPGKIFAGADATAVDGKVTHPTHSK